MPRQFVKNFVTFTLSNNRFPLYKMKMLEINKKVYCYAIYSHLYTYPTYPTQFWSFYK